MVEVAALYGGLWAGLLTLALSALVEICLWVEPAHAFTIRNPRGWLLAFLAGNRMVEHFGYLIIKHECSV